MTVDVDDRRKHEPRALHRLVASVWCFRDSKALARQCLLEDELLGMARRGFAGPAGITLVVGVLWTWRPGGYL